MRPQDIAKVQSTFEYFDADGNGCMDGPEFAKMAAELASRTDRDVSGREAFREIDADSSGSIEVRSQTAPERRLWARRRS